MDNPYRSCKPARIRSEYNEPWPGKIQALKSYAGGQHRLETNAQLYEGVRFAWIIFDPPATTEPAAEVAPWHITGLKIACQSKPVNYTGSFNSSDAVLAQSWYSGAYGSRLNMMPYGFNSILMDRGDRVSIQGDGHPTMAAALVAFGSADTYELVHKMLVKTDSGCANHSACPVVDSGQCPAPKQNNKNQQQKLKTQHTHKQDNFEEIREGLSLGGEGCSEKVFAQGGRGVF